MLKAIKWVGVAVVIVCVVLFAIFVLVMAAIIHHGGA